MSVTLSPDAVTPRNAPIQQAAWRFLQMGTPVVPTRRKKALNTWAELQDGQSESQFHEQNWGDADGIGLILREDRIVVLDFDNCSLPLVKTILAAMGLGDAWLERSQSGTGYHALFRLMPGTLGTDSGLKDIIYIPTTGTFNTFKQIELKLNRALAVLTTKWVEQSSPDDLNQLPRVSAEDVLIVLKRIGSVNSQFARGRVREYQGELIGEGERDNTLTSKAGALRDRGAEDTLIQAVLTELNTKVLETPIPDSDLWRIAKSVGSYVPKNDPAVAPKIDTDASLLDFPQTDTGNAERAARYFGDRVRYVTEEDQFIVYRDGYWRRDSNGIEVRRLITPMLRTYRQQAESLTNRSDRDDHIKHSLNSENSPKIRGMIDSMKPVCQSVSVNDLDKHSLQINLENGTYDLETGRLRPHDPADLHTRIVPIVFDPAAPEPTVFLRFLHSTFARNGTPDHGLISYVQRSIGHTLTGDTRERATFIAYGGGRNGKSTLLELIRQLTGDYGATANATTFDAERKSDKGEDIAKWVGVRYVLASELESGTKLATARIKSLAGRDSITVRHLYQSDFTFKPQFKIWLATNFLPSVSGSDQAAWDRLKLIPFNNRFDGTKEDKTLEAKLTAELPGILNWALDGAATWLREGIGTCDAVTSATQQYRDVSDTLKDWMDESCELDSTKGATATALHQSYLAWMKERGEEKFAVSQKTLILDLQRRGFIMGRTKGDPSLGRNLRAIVGLSVAGVGHFAGQSMPADRITLDQQFV